MDRQQAVRLWAHSDSVVYIYEGLDVVLARSLRHRRRKCHLIGQTRRSGSLLVAVLAEAGVQSSGRDQNPGRTLPANPQTLGGQGREPL